MFGPSATHPEPSVHYKQSLQKENCFSTHRTSDTKCRGFSPRNPFSNSLDISEVTYNLINTGVSVQLLRFRVSDCPCFR